MYILYIFPLQVHSFFLILCNLQNLIRTEPQGKKPQNNEH